MLEMSRLGAAMIKTMIMRGAKSSAVAGRSLLDISRQLLLIILAVYSMHCSFQAAVRSLSISRRFAAATYHTLRFRSSPSTRKCSKLSQSKVFSRRQMAMSSYSGYLGYSLSQSRLLILSSMFYYSHSLFSSRMEYSCSLLFMNCFMQSMNSKKTSFMPMVSSERLKRYLTSGRAHRISGNFMILLKWLSYFIFCFSGQPVRDLMKSRLRAVWMHRLWFYSHSFYRYYSIMSFISVVFSTIYFYRVLGEVRHSLIQFFAKNSSSFLRLISLRMNFSLAISFSFWKFMLDIALRQQALESCQVLVKKLKRSAVQCARSRITWAMLVPRLRICKYSILSLSEMRSMELRDQKPSRISMEKIKSSMVWALQNSWQHFTSTRLCKTCLSTFLSLLCLKASRQCLLQSMERWPGSLSSVNSTQDLLLRQSLPVTLSFLSPNTFEPQLIIQMRWTRLKSFQFTRLSSFSAPLMRSMSLLISATLRQTQKLLMESLSLGVFLRPAKPSSISSQMPSMRSWSMLITQWMQLAMLTFKLVTMRWNCLMKPQLMSLLLSRTTFFITNTTYSRFCCRYGDNFVAYAITRSTFSCDSSQKFITKSATTQSEFLLLKRWLRQRYSILQLMRMRGGMEQSILNKSLKKMSTMFLRMRLSGCSSSDLASPRLIIDPSCLFISSSSRIYSLDEQLKQGKLISSLMPRQLSSQSETQFLFLRLVRMPFRSFQSCCRRPQLQIFIFDFLSIGFCSQLWLFRGLQFIDFELYLLTIFKVLSGISFYSQSLLRKSITWSTLAIYSSVFLMSCLAQFLISPRSMTSCRISWQKFYQWKLISKQCFLSLISFLRQKAMTLSRSLLKTSSSTMFSYMLLAMALASGPRDSRLELCRYFYSSTIIRNGSFESVSSTYFTKVQTSPKPSSSNSRFSSWYCSACSDLSKEPLRLWLRSILVRSCWIIWQVDSPRLTMLRQYQKRVECSFFSNEFFCSCSVVSSRYYYFRSRCSLHIAVKSSSSRYCSCYRRPLSYISPLVRSAYSPRIGSGYCLCSSFSVCSLGCGYGSIILSIQQYEVTQAQLPITTLSIKYNPNKQGSCIPISLFNYIYERQNAGRRQLFAACRKIASWAHQTPGTSLPTQLPKWELWNINKKLITEVRRGQLQIAQSDLDFDSYINHATKQKALSKIYHSQEYYNYDRDFNLMLDLSQPIEEQSKNRSKDVKAEQLMKQKRTEEEARREFLRKLKSWEEQKRRLAKRREKVERKKQLLENNSEDKRRKEEEEINAFLKLEKKKLIEGRLRVIEERRVQREEMLQESSIKRHQSLPKFIQYDNKFKREQLRKSLEQKILLKNRKMSLEINLQQIKEHEREYINRIKQRLNMRSQNGKERQLSRSAEDSFNLHKRNPSEMRKLQDKISRLKKFQSKLRLIPLRIDPDKQLEAHIANDKLNHPHKYNFLSQKALSDQQIYREFKHFDLNIDRKQVGNQYFQELKQRNRMLKRKVESEKVLPSRHQHRNYIQQLRERRDSLLNPDQAETELKRSRSIHKKSGNNRIGKEESQQLLMQKSEMQQKKVVEKILQLKKIEKYQDSIKKEKEIDQHFAKALNAKIALLKLT